MCRTVFYLRCRFFICVVAFYLRCGFFICVQCFFYLHCGFFIRVVVFFICVVVFLFALWFVFCFFCFAPVGHLICRMSNRSRISDVKQKLCIECETETIYRLSFTRPVRKFRIATCLSHFLTCLPIISLGRQPSVCLILLLECRHPTQYANLIENYLPLSAC